VIFLAKGKKARKSTACPGHLWGKAGILRQGKKEGKKEVSEPRGRREKKKKAQEADLKRSPQSHVRNES